MQPQGHVQVVVVRIADYGQNPQAACDGPVFRWVDGLRVIVEGGFRALRHPRLVWAQPGETRDCRNVCCYPVRQIRGALT
jgi:hypothetical protein